MSGTAGPAIARFIGKAIGDDSLRGLSLSSGAQILGMIVDNFSGSWIYIPQTQQYVPPYTAGWASIVSPANASLDFIYQAGPIGLASSSAGSPAVVQLFGVAVQNSPGVPIVPASPPILSAVISGIEISTTSQYTATLIPGVADQRIRLYNVIVRTGSLPAPNGSTSLDSTVIGTLFPSSATASTGIPFMISNPVYGMALNFPNGYDLPVGDSLQLVLGTEWANIGAHVAVTYLYV